MSTSRIENARRTAARLLPGLLLIFPGSFFAFTAIGGLLGDQGAWTTIGMGVGAILWGLSLTWSSPRGTDG